MAVMVAVWMSMWMPMMAMAADRDGGDAAGGDGGNGDVPPPSVEEEGRWSGR